MGGAELGIEQFAISIELNDWSIAQFNPDANCASCQCRRLAPAQLLHRCADKSARMCMSLPRDFRRMALALCSSPPAAAPAAAQFGDRKPTPEPRSATVISKAGLVVERGPDLIVSSESLGIPGDDVDLVNDLGILEKRLRELRLVLRPATKHKFRFNYLPIKYDGRPRSCSASSCSTASAIGSGLPVNTSADLTTYRFGYEYDFIYRDRGYAGCSST